MKYEQQPTTIIQLSGGIDSTYVLLGTKIGLKSKKY